MYRVGWCSGRWGFFIIVYETSAVYKLFLLNVIIFSVV